MVRRGNDYKLTYEDSNLPSHYGWKWDSRLGELESRYELLKSGQTPAQDDVKLDHIRRIIEGLDERGRWVSVFEGERLVGQPKMPLGTQYLSSERFSRNLSTLGDFLLATGDSAEAAATESTVCHVMIEPATADTPRSDTEEFPARKTSSCFGITASAWNSTIILANGRR
jgi:hypothetical protein